MLFYWLVLVSAGAGHWAYLNRLARREQTEAAPERTEVIKEGRQTIHVTPSEKERLTILKDIYMWGGLSWLVLYLVARFLLGVKPHSVMSTLPEPEVQPTRNRSP